MEMTENSCKVTQLYKNSNVNQKRQIDDFMELTRDEKIILYKFFTLGETLKKIAEEMGIDRKEVIKIKKSGVSKAKAIKKVD